MDLLEGPVRIVRGHPAVQLVLWILGALIGTVTFFATIVAFQPVLDGWGGFIVFLVATGALITIVVVFLIFFLAAERRWKKRSEVSLLKALTRADKYDRFEKIASEVIRLGWVPFYPTLVMQPGENSPRGAGPEILRTVFDDKVKFVGKRSTWANVLNRLRDGEFDVVATPMYDVRERRGEVEFTTPIFYADIGLFFSMAGRTVPNLVDAHKALQEGQKRFAFKEALEILKPMESRLKFCVHVGELQQKMVKKHFADAATVEADIEEFSVASALDAMMEQDDEYHSDLYFCERIQGESHPEYGKRLFNVLKSGEILFPVGFAVRREDDGLRKFINLRLMTIEGDPELSVQSILEKSMRGIIAPSQMDKMHEYFIRSRGPVMRAGGEDEENVHLFSARTEGAA